MAFVETKHTLAAVDRIKKELSVFMMIISIGSMLIFSCYYAYLICSNLNSITHLIAYIVLFVIAIMSFIIEMVLKNKKNDSRKIIRLKVERKRFISIFTKSFKYLAKSITIGLALYETLTNPTSDLKLLINIGSCAVLVISLIAEFITYFANRYMDYLKIGFELDFDSSMVAKVFFKKQLKAKALETKVYTLQGDSIYTVQEQKIIQMLTTNADLLKKEREEALSLKIKTSKLEIKELTDKKLSIKQKEKVEKKYEASIVDATALMNMPEKLDKLLIKAENLVAKLPGDVSALKYIPEFLSLINNYISGKYKDISAKSVIATVAVIIYFVAPFDIIPDALPVVGYVDEAFVIGKCLEIIDEELEKFITWRSKNQ